MPDIWAEGKTISLETASGSRKAMLGRELIGGTIWSFFSYGSFLLGHYVELSVGLESIFVYYLLMYILHFSFCSLSVNATLNPVVSLAQFGRGQRPFSHVLLILGANTVAYTVGYYLVKQVSPVSLLELLVHPKPLLKLTFYEAMAIEACITALLVYFCLTSPKWNKKASKFILPAITVCLMYIGASTGALMNPAPALSLTLIHGDPFDLQHAVYWAGPLLGGILGAIARYVADNVLARRQKPSRLME